MLQGGEDRGGEMRAVVEAVDQVVVARDFSEAVMVLCAPEAGRVRKWRRRMPEEGGEGKTSKTACKVRLIRLGRIFP
jgi:hypothetical protein